MSGLSCGPAEEVGHVLMGVLSRLVAERGQISEAVARTGAEDTLAQVGRHVGRGGGAATGGEGEDDSDGEGELTFHAGYLLPLG